MSAERPRRIAAGCCLALLAWTAPAHAALCGDTTGDGFFKIGDVLKTLRLAVESGYDRRGDVVAPFGRITAGDALASLRASVAGVIPRCEGATATRAVVTTAAYDFYSSGGLAVVDLAAGPLGPHAVHFRGGAVQGDSVVRAPSGIPIVVNRQNFNTLQFLDVNLPALPNIKECSVSDGFNSNPQDVVLVSAHKGYVTPYKLGTLLVIDPAVLFNPAVDPACNGLITGRIDLSAFDSDGVPQMDQMVVVGSDLFVTLQLLDDASPLLAPKEPGRIVVIDTATDTVKTSIPLSFENPFAETQGLPYDEFQKLLFAGGPGTIGDDLDDGGIEAIDPVTMQSAGMLLTGADIHADIFDFVIVGTGRAFAIIADKDSNSVVDIDLKTRSIRKVLLSSTAMIADIEMTEFGQLWVAYRGETAEDPPGIRIFRVSDDTEVKAERTSLAQAPFTLTFLGD